MLLGCVESAVSDMMPGMELAPSPWSWGDEGGYLLRELSGRDHHCLGMMMWGQGNRGNRGDDR